MQTQLSGSKMSSILKTVLSVVLVSSSTGCIAPLPVSSVDDPWVHGTIVRNGVAAANLEVRLDHEGRGSCESAALRTVTDEDGRFKFEGKLRSWTWLGWANNHYVSGCILTPEGPRSFGIMAVNDPRSIDVHCDIALAAREMCKYDCDSEGFGGRC